MEAWVFLALLLTYGYFFQGGGWGPNAFFDLTRAIVERGRFLIDPDLANTGDWAKTPAGTIINKSPGVSFLAVPAYRVVHRFSPEGLATPIGAARTVHAVTVFSVGLFAALGGAFFYRIARRRVSERAAVGLTVVLALGTSVFSYATFLTTHAVVAACFVIAWERLFDGKRASAARAAVAGFVLSLAVVVESLSAPVILGYLVALLLNRAPRRAWFGLIFGALPPAILLAFYNVTTMGAPLASPYAFQNPIYTTPGAWLGVLGVPSATALYALTVHPIRGLFWISPVLAPAFFGLIAWTRREPRTAVVAAWGVLVYLAFSISFVRWHGGWCIGPRYLVPAYPFLVLALVPVLAWGRIARGAVALLGGLSVALHLAIVAVNPQVPQIAGMTNPLFEYVLPVLLRAGLVSVNNQGVLEGTTRGIASLSSPAEVWASYNLGELLGLRGVASLLPLLLAWVILAGIALRATSAPSAPSNR
jgi:hypothetical protein